MTIGNNEDFPFDWKDAPEWAKVAARDLDNNWYWFDRKPYLYKRADKREELRFSYTRSQLIKRGENNIIIIEKP